VADMSIPSRGKWLAPVDRFEDIEAALTAMIARGMPTDLPYRGVWRRDGAGDAYVWTDVPEEWLAGWANWHRAGTRVPAPRDAMPVFTIEGHDRLAIRAINYYADLCSELGLADQAREVLEAAREMRAWQQRNPDRMKHPDHQHQPVARGAVPAGSPQSNPSPPTTC
jgi:hypothetical protein